MAACAVDAILTAKTWDMNKVTFGELKTLETSSRIVYINYDGKPLYFQTPPMVSPFGVSKFAIDGTDTKKYSIEIAFKNRETSARERMFFEKLQAFDRKVLDTVLENSGTWLKKKHNSLEVIEALYTPCIKVPKDKNGEATDKYAPTFRLSLPMRGMDFMCTTEDATSGLPLNLLDLEQTGAAKQALVTAIVQITGIWIAGGKFGPTARVKHLVIQLNNSILPKCAFEEDDEEVQPTELMEVTVEEVVLVEQIEQPLAPVSKAAKKGKKTQAVTDL
ncbi:hypothetical protein CEUSTIGMA_g13281.t1 [Chlamydomonas eustigma]|uniref:Uncharacterized protein n=1 Tax=Chlamydomonas eustigma TaxID=1157962 RepID=A0A250XS35_9CHLO|nr:hypothetical protein CEUSTIGMA_g13281.t1 [Chlamydomonas eustigma]|eukprot:GAX85865.1 hypothetical protein CEUSTIGMA_g13281.t1 [Chlamydomonas eustigma]